MRQLFFYVILFGLLSGGIPVSFAGTGEDTPETQRTECYGNEASEDTDGDGLCNNLDLDDDNDGCLDAFDDEPLRAGPDTDGDGLANYCDLDDDNDGVLDTEDPEPFNPGICGDRDNDGCDDCSVGFDGFGSFYDFDPMNDGPDANHDGICDNAACGPPQHLSAELADWFHADLSWDGVINADSYQLQIKLTILPVVLDYATVTDNAYSTWLFPFLTYEYRVRANCGAGYDEWSEWYAFSQNPWINGGAGVAGNPFESRGDAGLLAVREFKTWPNPTNGKLNMEYSGEALYDAELTVTDLSGRLVHFDILDWLPNEQKSLDLNHLENGMYLVNLTRDGILLSTEKIFLSK